MNTSISRKSFFWNMLGSICYSVSSFSYLLVVTRVCGVEIAGFFSLSYATAQLLLCVGRYGMRTYQATDLRQEYLFSEYAVSRVLTCAAMLVAGIIYSALSFDASHAIISIFIIAMKMIDASEDVYHGRLQQMDQIETMGKMLALRNTFTAIWFTVVLIVSRNLLLTCASSVILSFILCQYSNAHALRRTTSLLPPERNFEWRKVFSILKTCTPLFASTFLSLLLYNIPKYAMANVMSDVYQTYYSILFMPSFVITLMCEFVFKPTITTIARLWWAKEYRKFTRYILLIFAILAGCSALIVLAGRLIGLWLLGIVYGVELSDYAAQFVILLIGGGLSAMVYMLYNILIAIRHERSLLVVYSITAVLTILPARTMITSWGMTGAALNYGYSCLILLLLFAGTLWYVVAKNRNKEKADVR